MLVRSRLLHASRCARGEGAYRVRGTAVPNHNQAYSIRAVGKGAQDLPVLVGPISLRSCGCAVLLRLGTRLCPCCAHDNQFSVTAALPASRPKTALRVCPVNEG